MDDAVYREAAVTREWAWAKSFDDCCGCLEYYNANAARFNNRNGIFNILLLLAAVVAFMAGVVILMPRQSIIMYAIIAVVFSSILLVARHMYYRRMDIELDIRKNRIDSYMKRWPAIVSLAYEQDFDASAIPPEPEESTGYWALLDYQMPRRDQKTQQTEERASTHSGDNPPKVDDDFTEADGFLENSRLEPEPEASLEPELGVEPELEVEPEPETEAESGLEFMLEPEVGSETRIEPEPEIEFEIESGIEPGFETEPEPKAPRELSFDDLQQIIREMMG